MMCLIDHRGFRLIALSLIPINSSTIVYGSLDGGETIHHSDPNVNSEMEKIAKALNLKSHLVTSENKEFYIFGPSDIEVHKGTDSKYNPFFLLNEMNILIKNKKRYYACDFARLFPPEHSDFHKQKKPGSYLFYILRPELVKSFHKPLSSDALTKFGVMK